ncbi:MAG TPA: metal-dependent transcriptional regulator [Armatimonadota bacterium]|nr:metal-dependent transcriptional regulator [Armatimonadota bacterium]HOS44441.1 metal-dependent transcriptional regulator [Armatimonadota bacterium]
MTVGAADVSAQVEEYLEAICRIQERGEAATLTELARELAVAPPSALGMLRRMSEQGLVTYDRRTGAVLTARGQACAATLRRRHRLAECLLTDLLGMPWARAHEIACRFEHVIDDEVEAYLLDALHHPATCPHGNPLGGESPALTPLTAAPLGEPATLRRILNESAALLEYLHASGLRPGAVVTVHAAAPFDGPLTVDTGAERFALSREIAAHLLVEPGARA